MEITRRIRIILLLIVLPLSILAQKPEVQNLPDYDFKPYHFGFTIGLNVMDYDITKSGLYDSLYADVSRITPGFHVAGIFNLRLSEHFDFRLVPGITFGQRNLNFIQQKKDASGKVVVKEKEMQLSSSYLDFPILFKYKGERLNNVRPYFIGGFTIRYDMSSNKDFDDDNELYVKMNQLDYYYELGVGLDSYLQYFKLATEFKVCIGLNDMLNHEPHERYPIYTNSIDKMKSMLFMLSFHFE